MDLLLDAICVVDAAGRFVYISGACEKIFGYKPSELIGTEMMDLVHPDDRETTLATSREVMLGILTNHFENRYIRKDGSVAHIMWSANWPEDAQWRVAVAHDVTERKHNEAMQAAVYAISEAAAGAGAANLPTLFRRIHNIIIGLLPTSAFSIALHDPQTGQTTCPYYADDENADSMSASQDALSLSATVIRSGLPLLFKAQSSAAGPDNHVAIMDRKHDWLAVPLTTPEGIHGAVVIQNRAGAPAYSEQDQQLFHYISTQIAAAIQRSSILARLQFLSHYDQLTSLPNRLLLSDRIAMALARARREKGKAALLYLDMDKFKQVDDTHGHDVGDQLLQIVADRIIRCVRESDTVSRIGGDEFVVLLETLDSPQQAHVIAETIRNMLDQPIILANREMPVTSSIGIALYPDDGRDELRLLDLADSAMYKAKRNGATSRRGPAALARRPAPALPAMPDLWLRQC
jgi:diguanylate cyclase (GGDEF)-like protein/PAS domain S-box-containing protein